jgi:hypothetical protein
MLRRSVSLAFILASLGCALQAQAKDSCDTGVPLQCSSRLSAIIGETEVREASSSFLGGRTLEEVIEPLAVFNHVFARACQTHDWCYRHGWKTYGISRARCDENFYRRLRDECSDSALDTVLTVFTAGAWYLACQSAAFTYYQGVRNLGESSFKREDGECCEYLKRPASVPQCARDDRQTVDHDEDAPELSLLLGSDVQ